MTKGDHTAKKELAAVCGLFCRACHVLIATQEDPDRPAALAERYQRPVQDVRCIGCRTDRRCFFCRTVCTMASCAAGKGVEFCGTCAEYPCTGILGAINIGANDKDLTQSLRREKSLPAP